MRLVVDASAVVDIVLGTTRGRPALEQLRHSDDLHSVAHVDAEVLSAVARGQRHGSIAAGDVPDLLDQAGTLPMQRLPVTTALLQAAWSLRANVAMRDALYVAAAMALRARLLTTDDRLARAVPDLAVELH